jgi:ribonucleoside-diphosphate reductase alpha chain
MKLNNYSSFIHKSRYSRFIDEQGRRENWDETVNRYMAFMKKQLLDKHKYEIPQHIYKTVEKAIRNMDVMPSMRCMMTAGEALERQNIAGYNCSYLPIDDPKSFDEAMYILLCGTGVGFSVEAKYVNQLPEVPDQLFDSKTTIVVSDSKEGWAKALRQLIALLYAGEVATWDVRPLEAELLVQNPSLNYSNLLLGSSKRPKIVVCRPLNAMIFCARSGRLLLWVVCGVLR